MKSITKTKITQEQIKKLITVHFPDAKVSTITELTGGAFNAAYLIEGNDSIKNGIVLKIGPEITTEILTYEKDIIHTEVEVYGLLKDRQIPTPKILGYDFSRKSIPCDYFFMEKLEGITWTKALRKISKADRSELMRELGRCNASVHSVEGRWFGYIKEDTRFHFDSWSKAFTAMMNDILNDGRKRGYQLPYDEIEKILRRYKKLLDEVKTPKLVDFDMWAGNVFLRKNDSFHISGIVDFERCFYGDPYADFTSAMMLFRDVEKEKDFQEGYNEVSNSFLTVNDNDRKRMTLYRLYMALIMLVETYRYGKAYAMVMRLYSKKQIKKILKELNS